MFDLEIYFAIGTVQLPVVFSGFVYNVEFQVVQEAMKYDVILGWKGFLKLHEGCINAKTETLTLRKPDLCISGLAYLYKPVERHTMEYHS